MTTVTPPAAAGEDPEQKTYGMGTFAARGPGGDWQGHRGRYAGFSTLGASQRERGLTLVVLSNGLTDDIPAVQIWQDLAGVVP
jgi:CubicO group peptidase (beta-lactamase class C family)